MPEISDCHTTTGGVRDPEYIAHRTFRNGELEEATYSLNSPSGVLQIFNNITRKTVSYASFFEGHGGTDPDPPGKRESIRSLSKLERDLLRLSGKRFKEKYPNIQLSDTRIRTKGQRSDN